MFRRVTICAGIVAMTLVGAYAQTPDGMTPSDETACEIYQGSAFGLCNSYCEALDCDTNNPTDSREACDRVYANFERATHDNVQCPPSVEPQTEPESGCPCNFDVEFWTDPTLEANILHTAGLTACDPDSSSTNTCFECKVQMWTSFSNTVLSVVVDLREGNTFTKQDNLFFVATEPSPEPPPDGACFAQGSVNTTTFFVTVDPSTQEDAELPVTDAQFPMCLTDMTALHKEFLKLCPQ